MDSQYAWKYQSEPFTSVVLLEYAWFILDNVLPLSLELWRLAFLAEDSFQLAFKEAPLHQTLYVCLYHIQLHFMRNLYNACPSQCFFAAAMAPQLAAGNPEQPIVVVQQNSLKFWRQM